MVIEEKLRNIVAKLNREKIPSQYIRTALKEYMQSYVLNFIYGESDYGNVFIFTGGTCLRKVYGLSRLSEDLDFDITEEVDIKVFSEELKNYFVKKYMLKGVSVSIKQNGRQVLLKLSVLQKLGLATFNESPMLYLKLDITKSMSNRYKLQTKLLNDFDFNYLAKFYDFGTLMTGKIMAILYRNRLWGKENLETIKGRDYYDILWFLEKKVEPNYERAYELIQKEASVVVSDKSKLWDMVDAKVNLATTKFKEDFKRDLLPFIDNNNILSGYVDSYLDNYKREQEYLFNTHK